MPLHESPEARHFFSGSDVLSENLEEVVMDTAHWIALLVAAGLVLVAMTTAVIPGKGSTWRETSAGREQKTTEACVKCLITGPTPPISVEEEV